MASQQMGEIRNNFIVPRRTRADSQSFVAGERANMNNIADMRSRLSTLYPATYTNAVLDTMTVNDMVYALRVITGNTYANF